MNTKHWTRSRTIAFNILAAGVAAIPAILPDIRGFSVPLYIGLSIAVPMANIWLRSVTTQPVSLKK